MHPIEENNDIDINKEFRQAFELIERTSAPVFLTGKAGTGKSTFLRYFRDHTTKKTVVLAPTGVAALNIHGQTIHSFFNFKPDITVDNLNVVRVSKNMAKVYRNLEIIVIDEISMVRADLLDCVDAFLRIYGPTSRHPFGGVQMIFIGDLYQLAPVVRGTEKEIFQTVYRSPYFFDSKVFSELQMEYLEFGKNYRQKDAAFLDLLNHIRNNTVEQEQLDILNARVQRDYVPDDKEFIVYLTTTNKLADEINEQRLRELNTESFAWEGEVEGEFATNDLPTQANLLLKTGAQVIMLNNDPAHRWVNGSIGKIVNVFDTVGGKAVVTVHLANGEKVEVELFTWEIFRFFFNDDTQTIESEIVGTFKQFPLKLAWAVTIHKSQGKTFEKVIIDIGRGAFCHGQLYVALSRCTSLEGIILKRPISRSDIFIDHQITTFLTDHRYKQAEKTWPDEEKLKIIEDAIQFGQALLIVYVKEDGSVRDRKIIPRHVKTITYNGHKGYGLEAFCLERQTNWIFRLKCIVDIKVIPEGAEIPTEF